VGRELRKRAVERASPGTRTFDQLFQTYLEECVESDTNHSHLGLVERILAAGGLTRDDIRALVPNGPNAAAIALYKDIADRGPACHLVAAGAVEYYYAKLTPGIFEAYCDRYGFSEEDAETYKIHGDMDATHAARAFAALDEAVALHGPCLVLASTRDAFTATSLHYDAMLLAATGDLRYWDGRS
jgi:pyrroloquinoline quinone (PQQ) biosynthesis protein C